VSVYGVCVCVCVCVSLPLIGLYCCSRFVSDSVCHHFLLEDIRFVVVILQQFRLMPAHDLDDDTMAPSQHGSYLLDEDVGWVGCRHRSV